MPHTIQGLDTAELVASADRWLVPHPPGFPLYIWLQGTFIHLLSYGPVFERAALFTVLLSIVTLALISRTSRSTIGLFIVTIPLALAPVYWRYSVLPDVFMLNCSILAAMLYVYFKWSSSTRRVWTLSILFALGCCNHPTIIFALPLLIDAWMEWRSARDFLISALVMTFIVCGFYSSLFLLNTHALYSWGDLRTWGDLLHHMLRTDYGTFQLSGHKTTAMPLHNLLFVWTHLAAAIPAGLVIVVLTLIQMIRVRQVDRHYLVAFGALLIYIVVFFSLSNVDNVDILERFLLFPLILTSVLAAVGLVYLMFQDFAKQRLLSYGLLIVALLVAGANYSQQRIQNDYSWNTIIEDYARNLLNMSTDDAKTVFIVQTDTVCSGLPYLQMVENEHPNALTLCLGNLFDKKTLGKIQKTHPDFVFGTGWDKAISRGIFKYLIEPNIDHYQFILTDPVRKKGLKMTVLGLGRKFSEGTGFALNPSSLKKIQIRSTPKRLPNNRHFIERALFAQYSYYYLDAGMGAKSPEESLKLFKKALDIVPYCIPAMRNVCALEQHTNNYQKCAADFNTLLKSSIKYF